jgi:hypothetical protein
MVGKVIIQNIINANEIFYTRFKLLSFLIILTSKEKYLLSDN